MPASFTLLNTFRAPDTSKSSIEEIGSTRPMASARRYASNVRRRTSGETDATTLLVSNCIIVSPFAKADRCRGYRVRSREQKRYRANNLAGRRAAASPTAAVQSKGDGGVLDCTQTV